MNMYIRLFAAGALCVLITAADVSAQAVGILIMRDGQTRVQGELTYRSASRVYEIKDPVKKISRTVSADQVLEARVRAPQALSAAVGAVQAGRYTGPHIEQLKKIVSDYWMLQHDVTAGAALLRAYVESGNANEAVLQGEKFLTSRRRAAIPGALVSAYWDALLKSGKDAKLENEISRVVAEGASDAVAAAYIIKGDIQKKAGEYEAALIDGYLRAIVLYREIREVQPEALYKAALCFDELNQVTHAEKMRKKLVEGYPKSEYTRRLSSGG